MLLKDRGCICCICIVGNGNVILNLALFQKLGVGSKRARCPVLGSVPYIAKSGSS